MNLNKIGKVFTSKFVGTGPLSYEKRIYRPAVYTKVEKHWFRDKKFVTKNAIYISMSYLDEVLLKYYSINTLRTGSFKLFKRPFPGLLTILTFKLRIKSHLLFAGIISSPFSPR